MEANDPRRGTHRYKVATDLINKTIETIGPAVFDVLGENSDERLTDAFFDVLSEATGPGPYTLEVAKVLNDTHVAAQTLSLDYGVGVENGVMEVYLSDEDRTSELLIPVEEIEEDTLFSALKSNLAEFPLIART
jgi:hypothetical protein